MKTALVLFLVHLILSVNYCVAADTEIYTLDGQIEVPSTTESAVLQLTFRNNSDEAACFEVWANSNRLPVKDTYQNIFLVRDSSGELAPYRSRIASFDVKGSNTQVYVVPGGESTRAMYDLAKLYTLESGRYTVAAFLSVVSCRAYDSGWPSLPRPTELSYLSALRGKDLGQMKKSFDSDPRWRDFGRIVHLGPVAFDVVPPGR